MERKYIDAESFKETLDYYIKEVGWSAEANAALGWCKEFVDSERAADVRPVVHGHWVRAETPGLMKCSECGRYATHSEILEWDYCNCGADMRQRRE